MASESSPQFRSIKAHVSEPSHRLPEEIIEEILSRLPVKSLLRFRCVSKHWRDLIVSKSFVKKHLANSTENPNFANHKIIFDSVIPWWRGFKQCSLTSMLNDPFTVKFKSCDLDNIRWNLSRIVGCCDGLVCLLLDRKHFMLWNPSTRKTKILPHIDGRIIKRGLITSYGFGYDDLSGDYMVFGIAVLFGSGGRFETWKVYSLKTNSWKIVEVENVSRFTHWGKFASGKIHWRAKNGYVTYFDLRSETFDVIKPPITNGVFCESVGVFGGRACLLCDDRVGNLVIWVIKEYGVNASWEKAINISYLRTTRVPRGVSFSPQEASLSILDIGPNGEILLTTRLSFDIFYPKGSGFRHCGVRGPGSFRAYMYVQSLVQCTREMHN